jgi:hypothetical protein
MINPNGGNVGIGTTTPAYSLEVNGDIGLTNDLFIDNGKTISAKNSAGTYENFLKPRFGDDVTYLNYGSCGFNIQNNCSVSKMFITGSGCVGIGTLSPSCPLDVEVSVNMDVGAYNAQVSIKAASTIWCGDLIQISSDKRIKSNVVPIDIDEALKSINLIKPVYYSYIDTAKHGTAMTAGFIAQDIGNVLKDSVKKSTEFVPDIMRSSIVLDGYKNVLQLPGHKILPGETIKMYDDKQNVIIGVVSDCTEDSFTVLSSAPFIGGSMFVYGRQVDDFHVLNYEYIMTQNVAATQALYKESVQQKEMISLLQSRLSFLEERL